MVISYHLEKEILKSIKEFLGISENDDSFDKDLIVYANGALNILTQVNVGSDIILTDQSKWKHFIEAPLEATLGMIIQYVCLSTKVIFDPPPPSTRDVMTGRIDELLWRLQLQYSYIDVDPVLDKPDAERRWEYE